MFLFDEPLSNLDAKLRTQVRWEIGKLHKRLGTTVMYVTHDQVEAMTLADKIVIMRDGNVEQVGTPEQVFSAPNSTFVATFIGSPSMNLISARVDKGQLRAKDWAIPLPNRFGGGCVNEGQLVKLGVRPSEIHLVPAGTPGAISATVEVTEYLGDDALLDLRVGETEIIAQIPAAQRPGNDAIVNLAFRASAIHLFDANTGKSVLI